MLLLLPVLIHSQGRVTVLKVQNLKCTERDHAKMTCVTLLLRCDERYVETVTGGGRKYDLYVHSFLGYGLLAARMAVLKVRECGPACRQARGRARACRIPPAPPTHS